LNTPLVVADSYNIILQASEWVTTKRRRRPLRRRMFTAAQKTGCRPVGVEVLWDGMFHTNDKALITAHGSLGMPLPVGNINPSVDMYRCTQQWTYLYAH